MSAEKTVGMCSRGQVGCHGLVFASTNPTYALMFVAHHRWLGLVWPADLQFRLVLAQRLGVASGIAAHVSAQRSSLRHSQSAEAIL